MTPEQQSLPLEEQSKDVSSPNRPFSFAALPGCFLKRLSGMRMSLRYKLISLFIMAILLPALLFSVVLTALSRSYIHTLIIKQQQEIVRRIADQIRYQLKRHVDILYAYDDIGSWPAKKQYEVARDILRPRDRVFSELALLNAQGQELWKFQKVENETANTVDILPVRELVNRSRRSEYQFPFTRRDLFVSQVNFSVDRHPYILLSVPLSGRKGVLVAKLNLDLIWQWIEEVKVGETGIAFVVDRNGNLIVHPEKERVFAHTNFGNLPVVKDFMQARTGPGSNIPKKEYEYRDERGEKVVSLYEALPDNLGWGVFTQIPVQEVYRPIKKLQQNIFGWTIFWTVVFLFIGFSMVQRIANPLSVLQEGAQKIRQGKLDIKLDVHTGDELEELAHNFEDMADALKHLETLRQDLTRMIIHDLKSPLSGIMGSLDYLESGLMGEFTEEQKKIISLAKKSSETMLVMIQNLLDVAKMEEGKLDLHKEKFDLAQMLLERQTQYTPLAANENKTITVDITPGLPQIEAEKHLIERVINNLMSNAMNHTTAQGQIWLRLKRVGKFLEVTVADNGAGVPPEYIDKIFEKFVQVKRRQAHLRTGAGLGLTFCRMVVETHGGAIRVESELNRGSSFIFTLPL
jgi:signal transduction histidine kinase